MASTILHLDLPEYAGTTPNVKLYPLYGGAVLNSGAGDTATEDADTPGHFTITVTEAVVGFCLFRVTVAGVLVAWGITDQLADDAGPYWAGRPAEGAFIFAPLVGQTSDRVIGPTITLYLGEEIDVDVVVVDKNGDLGALAAYGNLRVVFEPSSGTTDLVVYEHPDLTITDNQITFTATATLTAATGTFPYAVRVVSNNRVLMAGNMTVKSAPKKDA